MDSGKKNSDDSLGRRVLANMFGFPFSQNERTESSGSCSCCKLYLFVQLTIVLIDELIEEVCPCVGGLECFVNYSWCWSTKSST